MNITSTQEVQYDDATHRYFLEDITYVSATQLVEHFVNKFDVEERSAWMAYRYGQTAQYWKDKWRMENRKSLVRGNAIHSYEENKLIKKGYDLQPFPVPVQEYKKDIPLKELPDGVYPELKCWRHDVRIAGRMDKGILRTVYLQSRLTVQQLYSLGLKGKQRFLDIEDHKTNKKIRTESFCRDGKFEMMLGPVSHLMDCELTHYTLQLSIYQYMGEYHGFLPGTRKLIYHPHSIPGLATSGSPKLINLPYFRDEVIAMIKSYNDKDTY